MLFALAACGSSKSSESSSAAQQTSAPEYVWTSEYKEIAVLDDSAYFSILAYSDSGLYGAMDEVVGQRELREGEEYEYEGQLNITQSFLYFIDYSGKMEKLTAFEPSSAPEIGEGMYNPWSYSYLSGLRLCDDGTLLVAEDLCLGWFDAPDVDWYSADYDSHYFYEQTIILRRLNPDGSEISRSEFSIGENEYLPGMCQDEDGNLLISSGDALRAISLDGEEVYTLSSENYIDTLITLPDGRVAVFLSGTSGTELSVLENGRLSESVALPKDVWSYSCFPGDENHTIYFVNGQYLYYWDIDSNESEKLINLIDCDVNPDNFSSCHVSKDGSLTYASNEYNSRTESFTLALTTLKQVPSSSVAQKTELTLATEYSDYSLTNLVISFNRSNPDYRIKILDYSEYNTDEDYSAGITKLTTEILAGNVPDILYLNNLPVQQLSAKGLLEDLTPYMNSDPDIDVSDFFENILEAAKYNGKLFITPSTFYIKTVIGASSIVGDEPGWSYEALNEALSLMPEGCTPFEEYTDRDTVLLNCLAVSLDEFVNWSTGEVDFENEEFYSILKFAAQFPEEYDWDNYDYTSTSESRIAQGLQMLQTSSLYGFDSAFYDSVNFGGDVTYVGYPTTSGSGNMIVFNTGYAMSASCENKEGAWEFLKTFFTKDYMEEQWAFPLSRSLYNEMRQEATRIDYQKDSSGNYLLDENGEKLPMSKYAFVNSSGEYTELYALSEEQASKIDQLIETTTRVYSQDSSILEIIEEQAQAFFAGQKSVEEVSRLIQSKANIYVNEQR